MSSVPCTIRTYNALVVKLVWSNVESYREGGGPLLVILDNQILALCKHSHQTYEWHSECFAYPVQHVTDCTKGHAAADELVRFVILDYIEVVRQVLDGTRGALSGGHAIKCQGRKECTLLSTDAGTFWFGRMARAKLPSRRVILIGGLVRRIQGLDAMIPDSCETLSCILGRVANESTNAPPCRAAANEFMNKTRKCKDICCAPAP
jgi:hypothetical protein